MYVTSKDVQHGFIIAPLAVYFAYQKRWDLEDAKIEGSWLGLIPLAVGVTSLTIGRLGTELMTMRSGFLFTLIGLVLLLLGKEIFRILAFPLFFLLNRRNHRVLCGPQQNLLQHRIGNHIRFLRNPRRVQSLRFHLRCRPRPGVVPPSFPRNCAVSRQFVLLLTRFEIVLKMQARCTAKDNKVDQ